MAVNKRVGDSLISDCPDGIRGKTFKYGVFRGNSPIEKFIMSLFVKAFGLEKYDMIPGSYSSIKTTGIIPDTNEDRVLKGVYQVSGSHQGLVAGNPLGQLYTFASPSDLLFARFPVRLSAWKNLIRVFQKPVWYSILVGLACFSSAFAVIYFAYKDITAFSHRGLLKVQEKYCTLK